MAEKLNLCWNDKPDCKNPDCRGGAFCVEAGIFEDQDEAEERFFNDIVKVVKK